ncbi:MAG: hypothetical protein DRN96_04880 [Thermoproteota archaeon]|nr:MAG: hypothetical protein DRN96_04880 [Candidatus Korarchaeota archaeon]RLG54303.1 MAG: hypothetical protein DRN99_05360 [Candidatus Korarchaeota archaeon]
MLIYVELEGKRLELTLPDGAKLADLYKAAKINREVYLAARRGRLLPDEAKLADGDEIKMIRVVSGG